MTNKISHSFQGPVADTSVLVAFSVAGEMDLLREVFSLLVIPQAVRRELIDQGIGWEGAETARRVVLNDEWVHVVCLPELGILVPLDLRLDPGESEVIALAQAWNALALLDEIAARRKAECFGIRFIGTLGILRIARERGRIEKVSPIVRRMRDGGIRYGDALIERFRAELGEA